MDPELLIMRYDIITTSSEAAAPYNQMEIINL